MTNGDKFLKNAKIKHGDKYDYSLIEYTNYNNKIKIICQIHGCFEQTPSTHLYKGGCPKCGVESKKNKQKKSLNIFLKDAKKVHGERYDYSLVNYKNAITKVIVKCNIHGIFEQTPSGHLSGRGCRLCGIIERANARLSDGKKFIEKGQIKHNNKYDYSLVKYINDASKVKIICIEHGLFEQRCNNHLNGQGCSKCGKKNLMEDKLVCKLKSIFPTIETQKRFEWLKNDKAHYQSLDIYIPYYDIAIEYQGRQHFEPVEIFGGENSFKETLRRDEQKRILCKANNIELFYFTYKIKDIPKNYVYEVLFDEEILIWKIKNLIIRYEMKYKIYSNGSQIDDSGGQNYFI